MQSIRNFKKKFDKASPVNRVISCIVVGTVILVGFILIATYAATNYAVIEGESGTRSSAARVIADATASSDQALQFGSGVSGGGGSSSATIDGVERPGPNNTGPTNRSNLTARGGGTITVDGTVIENVAIVGTLTIRANNVTIRNFTLDGGIYGINANYGHSGLVIEDGEIYDYDSAAILGSGFTARRLNIHDGNGDGIKAQGGNLAGALVERSWIHRLGKGEGAHADGDQSRSGRNITYRYNHCDMPVNEKGGPGLPYKSNACFMLQTAEGPLENFLIEKNWLNGGNYTVYCPSAGVNVRVLNNRFGDGYRYGLFSGGGNCERTGNVWDATGEPV